MKIRCPGCGAVASLEILLGHEGAREAMVAVFRLSGCLGNALIRYLGLFRPESRELTMDRVARLLNELIPDIQRRRITRKNREWAAPMEVWINAVEVVLAAPNLQRPLKSHGYLYAVIAAQAEQVEAKAEQQREDARRYPYAEDRQPTQAPVSVSAVIERPPPKTEKTPMPAHVAEQIKSLGVSK